MDKKLEKVTGWKVALTKKAIPYWGAAALAGLVIYLLCCSNASSLNVDREQLNVAEAKRGEFNDYIRVSGQVEPLVTIQISPIEGGVVKEILIEEGSDVHKGDEILRLSNDNVELEILNCEAELAEKENILRNTQIQMEQDRLNVRQTRAE
nr:biotin/lipoyl-binding protein [Bacteroidales bacterium]